ncbi:MAG: DNA oxidative demethylase AlkB [Gammaproteobacteria bacterium]|nr:DNA oxidative demethylase AlkB [Gammaproteobacteria bacterium]
MTPRETRSSTADLFADAPTEPRSEALVSGAVVLRAFAIPYVTQIFTALRTITAAAPFRHMVTPGGFEMSVAMTNCGAYGWVTDRTGYRYTADDPESGLPWPSLPEAFGQLAVAAAAAAGFGGFAPDACLINRYAAGTRLSLHQDRNERDFDAPIVSVSLGLPAIFLFGGARRADRAQRVPLWHGDVVVWGGPARLHYHGVLPLAAGEHSITGPYRFNLTLRKAV